MSERKIIPFEEVQFRSAIRKIRDITPSRQFRAQLGEIEANRSRNMLRVTPLDLFRPRSR